MRTDLVRLPALNDDQLNEEQEEILAPFRADNTDFGVSRTFVRHPKALKAFRVWASYVMLTKNRLHEREREILALRTAWDIKCGYAWSRHLSYAAAAGLSDEEIEALKRPVTDHAWSQADAALIRATDALVSDFFVPDEEWNALSRSFDEEQVMDAIFCVGHFMLMGSFLNTAGVPIDPDVSLDPELDLRVKEIR